VITLDASVLIAHLNPADIHHQAATALLLGGVHGQLLVHTVTLAEVLVGGVRIGQGASMRGDLYAAGIAIAPHDDARRCDWPKYAPAGSNYPTATFSTSPSITRPPSQPSTTRSLPRPDGVAYR